MTGTLPIEDLFLERADHQGQIGPPHKPKLLRPSPGHGRCKRWVLPELGFPVLPQEVQVHRVEDNLGLRGEPLHACSGAGRRSRPET